MTHPSTAASLPAADADPGRRARPRSAVSAGVGLVGLIGLFAYLLIARYAPQIAGAFGIDWGGRGPMSGPASAVASVLACGLPMVLWSVFVDKVHRNPSTGIDWSRRRPWRETLDISFTKLAGLWATWALIAFAYFVMRYYWQGPYAFAMSLLAHAAPWLLLASVPYMLWLDRRMIEPRDGCYAFGRWLIASGAPVDARAIAHHLRAWTVKGFFTAFMLSIVPGNFSALVAVQMSEVLANPYMTGLWTINLLYLVDVHIATVGYILTLKPLDAHIRTANPYGMAWVAALICYPPFILMNGGPLDYQVGGADWGYWLQGHETLMTIWGIVLALLIAVYAWATMAFGIRFSNLTHRGIITHGPYALTRHPAYIAKNLSWWVGSMPFLVTSGSWVEALRNMVLLGLVSGVYYWRAKTEEKHLLGDPAYQAYWNWAQANAPVPRFFAKLTGRTVPLIRLEPDPRVGPVA
ncbi:methyltransferase family protein [Sphingopyxis indica]|uniref:Isoprenylcysteine carboxyl methyltransferase (ICMT) family protein n=1 Tax=Sphingopyxis indica TaxID=436663 RepID=A0A239HQ01_9SPHN|nr:isoprenylcysteine carboxylmethyltransferase family protein [Sphingopyxis indica]SNS83427.1 Isoprenylcysteine carboxyl methyltransferase (ICMT) family protein [Sphingopyxis indica]